MQRLMLERRVPESHSQGTPPDPPTHHEKVPWMTGTASREMNTLNPSLLQAARLRGEGNGVSACCSTGREVQWGRATR